MNQKSTNYFLCCLFLFFVSIESINAQTKVAITIDDVPNTTRFKQDNYKSHLLEELDELNLPIAIFINEGLIYKTDSFADNFGLLNDWIKKEYVTAGNHSFSHKRYSEVGFEVFKQEVEKGEYITRELVRKYKKPLHYFRLPYNDLGKDESQHKKLDSLFKAKKYISTPFTFESSDWMFSYLYEYYLKRDNKIEAKKIGDTYVEKTIAYFKFFDSLSTLQYGRKINQIYLCHDNALNANFLGKIVTGLKALNCQFISLEEALVDPVYAQGDQYYRKWGVSWFYRWMDDQKERVKLMRKEPDMADTNELYNKLTSVKE